MEIHCGFYQFWIGIWFYLMRNPMEKAGKFIKLSLFFSDKFTCKTTVQVKSGSVSHLTIIIPLFSQVSLLAPLLFDIYLGLLTKKWIY